MLRRAATPNRNTTPIPKATTRRSKVITPRKGGITRSKGTTSNHKIHKAGIIRRSNLLWQVSTGEFQMYEDEYHPELSEEDIEGFEDDFEDGVEAFFFDEEFGAPLTPAERQAQQAARQAAYTSPQAQQARAMRAQEAQSALQTGSGLVQMFAPLVQAGVQQAQADQAARRQRRQRPPRRATAPPRPRRQRAQGPQGPQGPPPGYYQQQSPMMMQRGPDPRGYMQQGGQGGSLRESDKKLMLYILGGTAVVVAGIGIFALAKK